MAIDQAFKDIRTVLKRSARAECIKQEARERKRIKNQFGGEDTENENL